MRKNAPEDWIIVENTHEPIILKKLWDKVQTRLEKRHKSRATKKDTIGLFSTLMICADCKSPLSYMLKPLKNKDIVVYRCSHYNNNGGNACTTHYIQEDIIANVILNDVRLYAEFAVNERESLTNLLLETMSNNKGAENHELQKREKGSREAVKSHYR